MLEDFGRDLLVEIEGADSSQTDGAPGLTRYVFDLLTETSDHDDLTCRHAEQVDHYRDEVIWALDGYDLHEEDDDERVRVDLFIAHNVDGAARQVTHAELAPVFRRVRAFAAAARQGEIYEGQDPEIVDVARVIAQSKALQEINLIVITNGVLTGTPDRSADVIDNVAVKRRVLDLNAIRRLRQPEAIAVDFGTSAQVGIPCVQLPATNEVYRSYLAVVPGSFLAEQYTKFSQRLLEGNVRSYLRASGKVNKGILKTIREEPHMFFAYNNGITATADEIAVEQAPGGGLTLVRCTNLQIVNGGQTTVSLYQAKRRKIPLDGVHIAMKISQVVARDRAADLVQCISVFANSQNKVNFSDLGANQPFHVRLQKLAEREVPRASGDAPKGGPDDDHRKRWYYERMRGQYAQDLSRLTPAKKRDFEARFPKPHVLAKTDVARHMMIWRGVPHFVCFGNEKNYGRFLEWAQKEGWLDEKGPKPDAQWFHELVAKVLLTRSCDAAAKTLNVSGYKVNIVAYTVALLSHLHAKEVDLEEIWQRQEVPEAVMEWFKAAIPTVRDHINKPPVDGMNHGEWSKKEDCWKRLIDGPFNFPRLSA